MIKQLVIHLGDTKTGSTSIQRALVNKVCKSPGVSICYPSSFHHNGLAATLDQKQHFDRRAIRFNRIYAALQKSNADHGIISAEHFQFVDPQDLHCAIATYWPDLADRMRLVAYVRPHGDKILSEYAEQVKLGTAMGSLEEFFEVMSQKDWMHYTKRFGAWRDIFGDRFELRPFVRERLYREDVVADFCKYVFQSEGFEIDGAIFANPSSTLSQLALLREMHRNVKVKLGSKKGPRLREAESALGRIVAEHMQANGLGQDSDRLRMPVALVDRFTNRFAADAEALDGAFFDGTPMSDALAKMHLKATDEVQSLEAGDHFGPDVINTVQVFADVLADILLENPDQFSQAVAGIRAKTDISAG